MTVTSGAELSRQVKEQGEFYTQESFSDLDCRNLDFSGAIFSEVVFNNCDFSGANLQEAAFNKCVFKGAKFINEAILNGTAEKGEKI